LCLSLSISSLKGSLAGQVTRIEVLGMHCSACSTAVETAMGAKKGVQKALVSLTLKMAEVTHDPQLVEEVGGDQHQLVIRNICSFTNNFCRKLWKDFELFAYCRLSWWH
jgi:copper chaperone CopZ